MNHTYYLRPKYFDWMFKNNFEWVFFIIKCFIVLLMLIPLGSSQLCGSLCVYLLLYLFLFSNIPLSGALSGLTAASSVTVSDPSSPNRHWASVKKPKSCLVSRSFSRSCRQKQKQMSFFERFCFLFPSL